MSLKEKKRSIVIQAFVEVKDKNGRVVARGKSRKGNLILNNFGLWLAGFIRAVVNFTKRVTLVDSGGSSQSVQIYHGDADHFCRTGYALGTVVQVGAGSTAPARDDYTIETPFGTSPEDSPFDTGTGSYVGGVISFSGAITAGGSGTVSEIGFFGKWWTVAGGVKNIMLFHDLITPTVAFTAGQTITVSYSISL